MGKGRVLISTEFICSSQESTNLTSLDIESNKEGHFPLQKEKERHDDDHKKDSREKGSEGTLHKQERYMVETDFDKSENENNYMERNQTQNDTKTKDTEVMRNKNSLSDVSTDEKYKTETKKDTKHIEQQSKAEEENHGDKRD